MPAVILCYTCRRRVTREEIDTGLHDHPEGLPQAQTAPISKPGNKEVIRGE